jgi:hypothetical protein
MAFIYFFLDKKVAKNQACLPKPSFLRQRQGCESLAWDSPHSIKNYETLPIPIAIGSRDQTP